MNEIARIIGRRRLATILDSAGANAFLQYAHRGKSLFIILFLALCWPGSPAAQTPFASYAYVVGRNPGIDFIGLAKLRSKDGVPDTWIALIHRNLAASLPHGAGNGYRVKWMRLYHPRVPGYRWDTIPDSNAPLLVVTMDQGRQILNHADGSIDGLNLATEGRLDLFVSDPTFRVGPNLPGMILHIETMDGSIEVPVAPANFYEHQY